MWNWIQSSHVFVQLFVNIILVRESRPKVAPRQCANRKRSLPGILFAKEIENRCLTDHHDQSQFLFHFSKMQVVEECGSQD